MRCRGLAWYPVVLLPIARLLPVWLPVPPLRILRLADVAACLTSDLGLLPDPESFVAVTEFLSRSEWAAQEVSANNFKILFAPLRAGRECRRESVMKCFIRHLPGGLLRAPRGPRSTASSGWPHNTQGPCMYEMQGP
jgi:hypothetical protein